MGNRASESAILKCLIQWPNVCSTIDTFVNRTTGNLYVADKGNHTIRKVTPQGEVHTVAGKTGEFGAKDGKNNEARFGRPSDVAVIGAGQLAITTSDAEVSGINF